MKKTRKILTCGILGILILVLPVVTVAGELSNVSSFVVRTETMEPYLKPNDIVMVSNSTSFDNLKIGDVIVFRAPEAKTEDGKPKVIAHRISDIGTFFEKKVVKTKGDANPYSIPGIDFPIFKEDYIGKVVSVINNTNTTITTNAETETETRTFQDCFPDILLTFRDNLNVDNPDPEYINKTIFLETLAKATCEFFHDKLGIWVNLFQANELLKFPEYQKELKEYIIEPVCEDVSNVLKEKYPYAELDPKQTCIAYMHGAMSAME